MKIIRTTQIYLINYIIPIDMLSFSRTPKNLIGTYILCLGTLQNEAKIRKIHQFFANLFEYF